MASSIDPPSFDPLYFERRDKPRHRSVRAIGKIAVAGRKCFCLVRDVSTGGLMIEMRDPPAPGTDVTIETPGLAACRARIAWRKNQFAGIAFDEPQNLDAICRRGIGEHCFKFASQRDRGALLILLSRHASPD